MKKLKLLPDQIKEFFTYVNRCLISDCIKDSVTFNNLLMFHLKSLSHKLQKLQLDVVYKARKSITITLNYAEQITLSYMFANVETDPFLKSLEFEIIGGL